MVHDHSAGLKSTDYLEYFYAYFKTSDFEEGKPANSDYGDVDLCRYPEFRNPPDHEHPYKVLILFFAILNRI